MNVFIMGLLSNNIFILFVKVHSPKWANLRYLLIQNQFVHEGPIHVGKDTEVVNLHQKYGPLVNINWNNRARINMYNKELTRAVAIDFNLPKKFIITLSEHLT